MTKDTVETLNEFHLTPIDLLRPLNLLDVTAVSDKASREAEITVVFVDGNWAPYFRETSALIKKIIPHSLVCMPTENDPPLFLFGKRLNLLVVSAVGTDGIFFADDLSALGGKVTRALSKKRFVRANVLLKGLPVDGSLSEKDILIHFVHGLQTPTYVCDDLKKEKDARMSLRRVTVSGVKLRRGEFEDAVEFANDLVRAEQYTRLWIDMPAQVNCKSTTDIIRLALRIIERHADTLCACKIIQGDGLNSAGLNTLWNVGRGRMPESPPALIIMRYMGGSEKDPTIALVGKCLVFDTGGEDKKPSGEFADMKCDMAGAAAPIAVFDMVAKRRARINLLVTIAVADNAISANSYHPGSVVRTYRGSAIEVNDTDAEGRLVLADAIEYTEANYEPDYLITLATLTGSIVSALGNGFAGLFPKTEKMARVLETASRASWNRVWRMPLCEATRIGKKESDVADLGNYAGRCGDAIFAAKFVMGFAETEDVAHLDIAGVAADGAYDATGEKAKFSTGWGPAILWETVRLLGEKKKKTGRAKKAPKIDI